MQHDWTKPVLAGHCATCHIISEILMVKIQEMTLRATIRPSSSRDAVHLQGKLPLRIPTTQHQQTQFPKNSTLGFRLLAPAVFWESSRQRSVDLLVPKWNRKIFALTSSRVASPGQVNLVWKWIMVNLQGIVNPLISSWIVITISNEFCWKKQSQVQQFITHCLWLIGSSATVHLQVSFFAKSERKSR